MCLILMCLVLMCLVLICLVFMCLVPMSFPCQSHLARLRGVQVLQCYVQAYTSPWRWFLDPLFLLGDCVLRSLHLACFLSWPEAPGPLARCTSCTVLVFALVCRSWNRLGRHHASEYGTRVEQYGPEGPIRTDDYDVPVRVVVQPLVGGIVRAGILAQSRRQ